jgi:hypothetical protein
VAGFGDASLGSGFGRGRADRWPRGVSTFARKPASASSASSTAAMPVPTSVLSAGTGQPSVFRLVQIKANGPIDLDQPNAGRRLTQF